MSLEVRYTILGLFAKTQKYIYPRRIYILESAKVKMAKTKSREILIKESRGTFVILPSSKSIGYDFDGLLSLRKLLTKEKARMLDVIKYKSPGSIYELAKILKRPFKGVMDDIKLLERFGFIDLLEEKTKKRIRHRPVIIVDTMNISIKI